MALYKGSKKIAGLIRGEDISHATEQHAGIIEIADQSEVLEGVIDSKAVTPKKMKDVLSDVAYSGEFNELLGKPTNLSDFNDDLGSSPVHTHNQYQETITDLDEIRSNASNAKSTVDTHVTNETIHVTASDKIAWSQKQNYITDLEDIRTNAKTGADLAPQVATNTERIEEIIVSRFPNVTIVGTPHIEGGQVSNYSDVNYLQFPFIDISRGQPFDIYFAFTTSEDVTTQQNILDSHFGIALAIQNGKGIIALSSNGTNWDIGSITGINTILPNTTYYAKLSWSGTEYTTALSTDDTQYIPDMRVNSNLTTYKTTIFIGGSPNIFGSGTAHPFKGTINFNKAKVMVNNLIVWQGMEDVGLATRANVSLDNLDDIGNARFTTLGAELDYENNQLSLLNTNGETLSSVTIEASGKVTTDNLTINTNSNEELQAIGVVEKNKSLIKYDWIGTEEEYNTAYEAGNIDPNWVCYITDDTKDDKSYNYEIGDIGIALYIDETKGLRRRLNGSLLAINNNTRPFLEWLYNVSAHCPSILTDESSWQAEISLSILGQCGKFVVDESAGTIRLPKVVNINGLQNLSQAGMKIDESLPNIKTNGAYTRGNNYITYPYTSSNDGPIVYSTEPYVYNISTDTSTANRDRFANISFDASRSSSTYQDDAPVQQEAIQYPYFIQIATGVEYEINIINKLETNIPYSLGDNKYTSNEIRNSSWLASNGQWNDRLIYQSFYDNYIGKIGENFGLGEIKNSTETYTDYDLVFNITDETFRLPLLNGEESIISEKFDELTLLPSGSTYTAPANGWFFLRKFSNAVNQFIGLYINDLTKGGVSSEVVCPLANMDNAVYVPVRKDQVVSCYYSMGGQTAEFRFVYAKGNGTLYYYVGETVQNASLIDAGNVLSQLATKPNFEQATALPFPSGRYIDLTLGASGTTYIAPANGIYAWRGNMTANGYHFGIMRNEAVSIGLGTIVRSPNTSQIATYLPVRKGDIVSVSYDGVSMGANTYFRFYYAEGNK